MSIKNKIIIFSISFILLLFSLLKAERWTNFSEAHGLGARSVTSAIISKDSILWAGTSDGLSWYNGEWHTFRKNKLGHTDNYVSALYEDREGIWIGELGGVSYINPKEDIYDSDAWINISYETMGLKNEYIIIEALCIDERDRLWIGTRGEGLLIFDRTPSGDKSWKDFVQDSSRWQHITVDDGLPSNSVFDIISANSGDIWIATGVGASIHSPSSGIWKHDIFENEFNPDTIFSLFQDKANYVWLGRNSGLEVVTADNYPSDLADSSKVIKDDVGFEKAVIEITEDDSKNLWIGTKDGAWRTFIGNVSSEIFFADTSLTFINLAELLAAEVSSIVQDYNKDMWFGTIANGISQFNFSWENYIFSENEGGNYIRGIVSDNQNYIWTGSNYGLSRLNISRGILNVDTKVFTSSNCNLNSNDILSLEYDENTNLWLGTSKGLSQVNITSEPIEINNYEKKDGLGSEKVYATCYDNFGYLWVGGKNGLSRVSTLTELTDSTNWEHFQPSNGLVDSTVLCITDDDSRYIWVGTINGLNKIDTKLGLENPSAWQKYYDKDGLLSNWINCLFVDSDRNLWIGTANGVNKLDLKANPHDSKSWESITTRDGLAADWIKEIYQTKDQHLWFATSSGVSRLTPDGQWLNYTARDGLSTNYTLSVCEDQSTNLWFGTDGGGVSVYRSEDDTPDTRIYTVYDLVSSNPIEFQYSGLDRTTPSYDLKYSYRVDDEEWSPFLSIKTTYIILEEKGKPTFHSFKVRAMDRDGNIDLTPDSTSFWKIDIQQGGHFPINVDNNLFEIFLPPNTLTNQDLYIDKIPLYDVPLIGFKNFSADSLDDALIDSLMSLNIFAFNILKRADNSLDIQKPITLKISFSKDIVPDKVPLVLYDINQDSMPISIGGTIGSGANESTALTTTIKKLGRYVVRKQSLSNPAVDEKEITIHPRIFSPMGSGQGHGDRATISFNLSNESYVTVKAYNTAGRLKRIILDNEMMSPGTNAVIWDGRDNEGTLCVTGLYIITVETGKHTLRKTVMIANNYQ